MTSQISAESAASAGAANDAGAGDEADVWDRLAALAFDGAPAHGGCSAQAHECTCRAAHAAAATENPAHGHECGQTAEDVHE